MKMIFNGPGGCCNNGFICFVGCTFVNSSCKSFHVSRSKKYQKETSISAKKCLIDFVATNVDLMTDLTLNLAHFRLLLYLFSDHPVLGQYRYRIGDAICMLIAPYSNAECCSNALCQVNPAHNNSFYTSFITSQIVTAED